VGGVNPTIQLAAALDRRGITVSIDLDRIRVHIHGHEQMVIQPRTEGVKPHDYGREWFWKYGGDFGTHPRDDIEGMADAVLKFILDGYAFGGTTLRYRIDHMGMTFQQETQEVLDRAKRTRDQADSA
jgi:hypothetical protein